MYNGVAALIAFSLPVVAKKTSRKFTHMLALVLGAIGLMSIFFISDYRILLLSMVGIGIAWASILSMPYAILTGSLPANKMGYYMGIFNFFIVIPQIVAATILGFLIGKIFGGDPVYAMLTGGVSFLIAAILIMFVEDSTDVKTNSA
jgi:maltose/moltooligosaccharide transporter